LRLPNTARHLQAPDYFDLDAQKIKRITLLAQQNRQEGLNTQFDPQN
jgi:hypothetical protein